MDASASDSADGSARVSEAIAMVDGSKTGISSGMGISAIGSGSIGVQAGHSTAGAVSAISTIGSSATTTVLIGCAGAGRVRISFARASCVTTSS